MKKTLKILTLALTLLVTINLLASPLAADDKAVSEKKQTLVADVFLEEATVGKQKLMNLVDGYSVLLPTEMQLEESPFGIPGTVLESKGRRLSIFKQEFRDINPSPNVYISYSKRFLDNKVDHRLLSRKRTKLHGYTAEITLWTRDKLAKVANDKNHYACIDIIAGGAAYTFLIKAEEPFASEREYLELLDGFKVFSPTRKAALPRIKTVANDSWSEETRALYEKYFSEDAALSWGIFEPTAPQGFTKLKALEERVNYKFDILLSYKHMHRKYPTNYVKNTLENAYNEGRIVELTLQTTTQEAGRGNMVYAALQGEYDEFLNSFIVEVVKFGHPVLFRFGNEMNGDWCEYSGYHTSMDPEIFVELYKYIYGLFSTAKADNVLWVWNPNEKSFPNYTWNQEMMYYPGDEYVDLVGLTGYNNGTYYKGEVWRSFVEIYEPLYKRMSAISEKPLLITEFSSSSVGGNKEQWTRNMFTHLGKFPRIKAAIWWNGCDWDAYGNVSRPYFIDESEELLDVFRENLSLKQ